MARNFLNTSHQTIGWFADQNDSGRLDLRPPFQRRPVWNNHEKSFLVDSVLRGYPVPEIYTYLARVAGSLTDTVSVVDGQQRLRACLEYMADGFPINFDVEKLRPMYTLEDTPWYGKRYSQLDPPERDTFRRYKFIVRELEEVTDEEIRHMFHRLNQSNVTLNAQELRYAMYSGGLLETAESLAKLKQWNTIGLFTVQQRRRMLDTEFIAELIIGLLHWPQNKKEALDHYFRQYAVSFPFADSVTETFNTVLDDLLAVFPAPHLNGTRWYRKSDFYTLFLAVARGHITIDRADVADLRSKLTEFSALVDSDVFASDFGSVSVYRDAVARAATDRARRQRREDALISFLSEGPLARTGSGVASDPVPVDEDDEDDDDGEYEDEE